MQLSQMTYVLLTHVCACAPLYKFDYDDTLLSVPNKLVRGFSGLGGSQKPHSERYKTEGNKEKFCNKPGF